MTKDQSDFVKINQGILRQLAQQTEYLSKMTAPKGGDRDMQQPLKYDDKDYQTIEEWFLTIDRYCKAKSISTTGQRHLIDQLMTPDIRLYISGLSKTRIATYAQIRDLLLDRYNSADRRCARRVEFRAMDMKPNQTLQNYMDSLVRTRLLGHDGETSTISEEEVIDRFLEGLHPPELARTVRVHFAGEDAEMRTIERVLKKAMRIDEAHRHSDSKQRNQRTPNTQNQPRQANNPRTTTTNPVRLTAPIPARSRPPRACFHCGETNHFMANCPTVKQGQVHAATINRLQMAKENSELRYDPDDEYSILPIATTDGEREMTIMHLAVNLDAAKTAAPGTGVLHCWDCGSVSHMRGPQCTGILKGSGSFLPRRLQKRPGQPLDIQTPCDPDTDKRILYELFDEIRLRSQQFAPWTGPMWNQQCAYCGGNDHLVGPLCDQLTQEFERRRPTLGTQQSNAQPMMQQQTQWTGRDNQQNTSQQRQNTFQRPVRHVMQLQECEPDEPEEQEYNKKYHDDPYYATTEKHLN